MCEDLLTTGCFLARGCRRCLLCVAACLFSGTRRVSELGQQLAARRLLITPELVMGRSSEHPPPSDFREISLCVWGGGARSGERVFAG